MARYIDATQLQAKILDASITNKLPESKEVLKIFDKMVHSMPTADVVPKSEVHDDHHKQVACYTLGCREGDKIKREVAREIFEEIESVCLKHIDRYDRYLMHCEDFAALKKKYTEENK